jgi:transposase
VAVSQREVFQIISWRSVKGRYFSYIVAVSQRDVFQLYRGGQSKGGISVISWRSVKGRYFSYIVVVRFIGGEVTGENHRPVANH